ncbi:MAG: hypothetical protein K2P52_08490 [Campylobacterales bacterium]|nr:hypothetical protein [Campylobacterales bacterium]
MIQIKITKFQVIKINEDYSCEILLTNDDRASAIEFLNDYVAREYKPDNMFTKAYCQDEKTIIIYNYFYIYPKQLVSKIQVVEYKELMDDSPIDEYPYTNQS